VRLGALKETAVGERRVALVPETVKRLVGKNFAVVVEAGAGASSGASDGDYVQAGATVAERADVIAAADLVFGVLPPTLDAIAHLREGTAYVSLLYPMVNADLVRTLAARKVTAIAADMIPRTTLAQMMDVLSSQATIVGYRAAVLAAHALPKMFPMLMTAAGTLAPARVLVLGAGVAGLQAIATSKRMGAVVEAFDVRKVVKEQVESLGAKFIEVPSDEDAQTTTGYARELSDDYKQKQADLITKHLRTADACICTALMPGVRAPILVTADMARCMRPGAVVVDIAAEQGGNCELTRPGHRVVDGGVTIVGDTNLASQVAVHASLMYSRNMEKFVVHLTKDGALRRDADDEIIRGVVITRGGEIVHKGVAEATARAAKGEAHD
jgi:NAD(P) transhydrogenase subunit alpha